MHNTENAANRSQRKSSPAIALLPIALSMMIWSGCAHYKVISANREVVPLKAGQKFEPPFDGWFVPDARWQEMREALSERIREMETGKKREDEE